MASRDVINVRINVNETMKVGGWLNARAFPRARLVSSIEGKPKSTLVHATHVDVEMSVDAHAIIQAIAGANPTRGT